MNLLCDALKTCNLEEVVYCLDEDPKCVNRFLKYKHKGGYKSWQGKCTPVFCAVSQNAVDIVKLLIERGANVDIPSYIRTESRQRKCTCFVYACEESYMSLLKLLVDAGADVDSPDDGWHEQEEEGGYLSYAERSSEEGLPGACPGVSPGITCLHWAIIKTRLPLVRELLNLGADPNLKSCQGLSSLHYAAQNFEDEYVKEIIRAGGVRCDLDTYRCTFLSEILIHRERSYDEALELVQLMLAAGHHIEHDTWLESLKLRESCYQDNDSEETVEGTNEEVQNVSAESGPRQVECPFEELTDPQYLLGNWEEFYPFLLEWISNPRSLKFTCRLLIRRTLGCIRLRHKIKQLKLPPVISKYLDLEII